MPDLLVTIVLPNGGARSAEVPDDVAVRDLLAEITPLLKLPTVGPDGRPMGYRLDSKALGRELREEETLRQAGVAGEGIAGVDKTGKPRFGNRHQVEIYLHNQYPQRWPGMKWLTKIWHPNINHLNGSVCIDAAWWPASRPPAPPGTMLGA